MTTYKFDLAAIVTLDLIIDGPATTARQIAASLDSIEYGSAQFGNEWPRSWEVTCIAPRGRPYLVDIDSPDDAEQTDEPIPQPFDEDDRDRLAEALAEGVAALEGDSNDAEHDALYGLCETLAGVLGVTFDPGSAE